MTNPDPTVGYLPCRCTDFLIPAEVSANVTNAEKAPAR